MRSSRCSLIALALAACVAASSGDRSVEFQNCVIQCSVDTCVSSSMLPLALQMTRWTCTDDCKYNCMHEMTDRAIELGNPVEQYFGKWPFWRLLGMQEPASVAFSLLNFWVHVAGIRRIRRRILDDHPMKSYYIWGAIVGMNAWTWSSVFHTRGG